MSFLRRTVAKDTLAENHNQLMYPEQESEIVKPLLNPCGAR
jgi:hypothetical protein